MKIRLHYDHASWIGATLITLPVWWVLGLDQFIWYLLAVILLFAVMTGRQGWRHTASSAEIVSLTILLISVGLSSIAVVDLDAQRKLTYARDALTWITIWIFVCTSFVPKDRLSSVTKMMIGVGLVSAVSSIGGLLAWILNLHTDFSSAAEYLLPSFVVKTGLGRTILEKSLVNNHLSLIFGFSLSRIKGLFLYGNTFAGGLGIAIPVCFYFFSSTSKLRKKVFWGIVLIADVISLLLTTSRSGVLASAAGLLVYLYLRFGRHLRRHARYMMIGAAGIVVVILIGFYWSALYRLVFDIIEARGGGTNVSVRTMLYVGALTKVLQNPFGYGTYMDMPGYGNALPPWGSHSEYIGILFKYGVEGLIAYGAFLLIVWRRWARGIRLARLLKDTNGKKMLAMLGWAMTTSCVHQITMESTLDLIVAMSNVTIWIAIAAYANYYEALLRDPERSPWQNRGYLV